VATMYRALYEYKSVLPDYLSFCAGDQFTVIDRINKDWFRAQNGMGQIGNVPCNYVTPVQVMCLLCVSVFSPNCPNTEYPGFSVHPMIDS